MDSSFWQICVFVSGKQSDSKHSHEVQLCFDYFDIDKFSVVRDAHKHKQTNRQKGLPPKSFHTNWKNAGVCRKTPINYAETLYLPTTWNSHQPPGALCFLKKCNARIGIRRSGARATACAFQLVLGRINNMHRGNAPVSNTRAVWCMGPCMAAGRDTLV